ncbi:MAG: ABC transporter permease [Clostridiales bacterium]|nr:ABC transporter permease [Clostridiales bacterium]
MNVFSKITLKSLLKNKTRTVVTIIGVMLSAALICAVTTSVSSFNTFALENMIYENGDWHGAALDTDLQTVRLVEGSDEVIETHAAQIIGYSPLEDSNNENKPYLFVLGADKGFEESMPVHIISGTYPKTENEILLPEHLMTNGGISYELGDKLTLELGVRIRDGRSIGQRSQFTVYDAETGREPGSDEEFVARETREFTVSGFYERPGFEPYSAPGYTAITLMDSDPSDAYSYDVYFKMKSPGDVYSFMEKNGLGYETNSNVLMFSGVSSHDNFYRVLYSLAAIVTALIVFGSVSLIYNAFSISISERTRQFGLLSSVGATKKQLRSSVFFEAFAVSVVGIPLGILVGIAGIGVTLHLIGDKFMDLGGFSIPMRLEITPAAILIAIAVAVITVFISALIPSKRATRISAIEAIRQTSDISVKPKKVRTSRITYKLFGLPGMLAQKYYKRSRKKYRATVVSLFMSVVLFVSASAFTGNLTETVRGGFSTKGYDLIYYSELSAQQENSVKELLSLIGGAKSVNETAVILEYVFSTTIEPGYLTQEASALMPEGQFEIPLGVCFVDDDNYLRLLEDNNLNKAHFMNADEPVAVAVDGVRLMDYEHDRMMNLRIIGSERFTVDIDLESPDGEINSRTLEAGVIITEKPFFLTQNTLLTLLYPFSSFDTVTKGFYSGLTADFLIKSGDHKASFESLRTILIENGYPTDRLYDYAEEAEQYRNIVTIVNVFAYGFIVLISLIAVANVFNTVSTNIILRRRDFAMLRSVGMAQKGFSRMMNFECVLYGTRALLFGLPVSVILAYLINRSVNLGYDLDFTLPWLSIAIAVLSVFAVVFAAMIYSMNRIRKENPIDALMNENL